MDPEKNQPDGGPVKAFLETGNLLSPSWVISKGLELAFDFNPVDEAKKLLAGDWEKYAECAQAWACLGDFCESLASNLRAGNKAMDASWNGNAGDAAYLYFKRLADDIEDLKTSFDSLKDKYDDVYQAVWYAAEAAGDLLSGILDLAAVVGLTAAAGASTSFTLFGPVVAAGAIAAEITAMINMWSKLTATIATVQTSVSGTMGVSVGLTQLARTSMVSFPLPGRGYDHPEV